MYNFATIEVLAPVFKIQAFWFVTPCSLLNTDILMDVTSLSLTVNFPEDGRQLASSKLR